MAGFTIRRETRTDLPALGRLGAPLVRALREEAGFIHDVLVEESARRLGMVEMTREI
ncbi:MAG: hypothetical protein AB7K63_19860 [Vicinamibacterales bacterium]